MARSQRYTDQMLLEELQACAARLGRSPTMREFVLDPKAKPHPQTVVTRFGSWNRAKRKAGLVARRFATREELVQQLQELGVELGRTPTGPDLARRRSSMPSKSLYWQVFGSFPAALRAAGFDAPGGKERSQRAVDDGVRLAKALGRLPSFDDWARARVRAPELPSEWQVYRLFGGRKGAWSAFQKKIERRMTSAQPRERQRARRARPEAQDKSGAPPARARRGGAPR